MSNDLIQWTPGQPADKAGAFLLLFDNGANGVEWDGAKYPNWFCVLAYIRIPERPKLKKGPRIEAHPGYWTSFYELDDK